MRLTAGGNDARMDDEPRGGDGQAPEETEEGAPVPDPERDDGGDAEDVPTAD